MIIFSWYKTAIIFFTFLISIYFALPNFFYQRVDDSNLFLNEIKNNQSNLQEFSLDRSKWPSWLSSRILNLGLDLRGGAHLLVEIDTNKLFNEKLNNFWPIVRDKLRENVELYGNIKKIKNEDNLLIVKIQISENINSAIQDINSFNKKIQSLNNINARQFNIDQIEFYLEPFRKLFPR